VTDSLSLLRRFMRATPRRTLTPGRLYALMAGEFKATRADGHWLCTMPMVVPARGTVGLKGANWYLQGMTSQCDECSRLARGIGLRFGASFDVSDPQPLPLLVLTREEALKVGALEA
jgi:hypothetical protein